MPIYVFQCRRCDVRTEAFFRSIAAREPSRSPCESCGSEDSPASTPRLRSTAPSWTKIEQLDPKYFKRVDQALANTAEADPMRHLKKMTPFDCAPDPGDPINF